MVTNNSDDQSQYLREQSNHQSLLIDPVLINHIPNSNNVVVYISDLPYDIPQHDVEQIIQTRLKGNLIETIAVEYYQKLGIAVVLLTKEDDKRRLIQEIESVVFDTKTQTIVSFADDIERICYITFDKDILNIPSIEEIASHWSKVFKTKQTPMIEPISMEFPNILRIHVHSFDEFLEVAEISVINVANTLATIYAQANCSFLEDMPTTATDEKISAAISAQIGVSGLEKSSLYVQCNQRTGNVTILVSNAARKWSQHTSLTFDGRNIPKKVKLAYRLIISPVPEHFNINRITQHTLFNNCILNCKHIKDVLIAEFAEKDTFEKCLSIGALRIDDNVMKIAPHTIVTDPESVEINAENWYQTKMFDHSPTIMAFVDNPQHPIFCYKWNAQNWLEQFKQNVSNDRTSNSNHKLHLLRMTVMLNTIATVRKKSYIIDNRQVILNSKRMQTIIYDHKSKISNEKQVSSKEINTPYPSTSIHVVNEDNLIVYQRLITKGHRPLLLTMAHSTSPGGNYRKGDGAQEENFFRRSDYYQSLDLEIADLDRSERFHCTDKCVLETIPSYGRLYPMDEFGAIYTSGITVLRQTEANGYAYMDEPLYNVCSIAMAAYREPQLKDNNTLANKYAAGTYKKIENILSIAHHYRHDSLVLSAFGCGAFKNPPEHVALLFKSAIKKYAGFFKTIYFAVIDDHKTGYMNNPQGNFFPFKQILDGLIVRPSNTIFINGARGPYRILNKLTDEQVTLSDVYILDRLPCYHGAKCNDLRNIQHDKLYSHPPLCFDSDKTLTCNLINEEVHAYCFIHNLKCKNGGKCNNTDPKHLIEYDHPGFCNDSSSCVNMSPEHLFAYQHLPCCQHALTCDKYLQQDLDHMKKFRHNKLICSYDNCCIHFHDKDHFNKTVHSFNPPCPFTPYNCQMYVKYSQSSVKDIPREIENHCLRYSHICPYGRQCKKKSEEQHLKTSIHIARKFCPNSNRCSKLNQDDHLETFSHPDIRDIRLLCEYPGYQCPKRSDDRHLKKYRHGRNHNHFRVARYSGCNTSINFFDNQIRLVQSIDYYFSGINSNLTKPSQEILNWIRALQPVHRCKKDIFESILLHNHVMSRDYMRLLKNPQNVANAIQQHHSVCRICLHHNNSALKEHIYMHLLKL